MAGPARAKKETTASSRGRSKELPKEKKTRQLPPRIIKTVERYDPSDPNRNIISETESSSKAAAASSPKKRTTRAPPSKKKTSMKNKPYISLIKQAIRNNEEKACHHQFSRNYVSALIIENWIRANFEVSLVFPSAFKQALRNGVAQKKLFQIKNSFAVSKAKKKKRSSSRSRSRSRSASPARGKKETSTKKKSTRASSSSRSASPAKKKSTSSSSRKKVVTPKSSESSESSPRRKTKNSNNNNNNSSTTTEKAPPALKRGESVVAVPSSKYSHFWQYWDGRWQNYDIKASDAVEKVYLDYLKNRGNNDVRAVKSGQWEYQVDFDAMKQTNINHENHTTRNIRRVPNTAAISGEGEESSSSSSEKEE